MGIPYQEPDGGSRGSTAACDATGVEAIRRCPRALLWPETAALLRLHSHWPDRLMLAGGLYDQPTVYLEAMEFLDARIGELREAQRMEEEAMRNARGNARHPR